MKTAWKKWMKLAKVMMGFWANVFLTLFFIVIIIPVGFILKLLFPEVLKGNSAQKSNGKTYWSKHPKIKQDLDFAKEQ